MNEQGLRGARRAPKRTGLHVGSQVIIKASKLPATIIESKGHKKWVVEYVINGSVCRDEASSQKLQFPKDAEMVLFENLRSPQEDFQIKSPQEDTPTDTDANIEASTAVETAASPHGFLEVQDENENEEHNNTSNQEGSFTFDHISNDEDEDDNNNESDSSNCLRGGEAPSCVGNDATFQVETVPEQDEEPDPDAEEDDDVIEPQRGQSNQNADNEEETDPVVAYEEQFAAMLEGSDNDYQAKRLLYQLDREKLIEESWTVVKKPSAAKVIGIGIAVQERLGEQRQGVVVGGNRSNWTVCLHTNETIELPSTWLKKVDDTQEYVWKCVGDSDPEIGKGITEYLELGLTGFDFSKFDDEKIGKENKNYEFPYLQLLKKLWPGDPEQQRKNLNSYIENSHNKNKPKKHKMRLVSQHEWWRFIGTLIGASPLGRGGKKLWEKAKNVFERKFTPHVDLGPDGMKIFSLDRFQKIRAVFPYAFYNWENTNDPWHPIKKLINDFNSNWNAFIAASATLVLDELMSAYRPRTTATGWLPNISFILRKPEPLGTEFKCTCCPVTGVLLYVEVQRGKKGIESARLNAELGATAGCTVRLVKGSQFSGQKHSERQAAKENFKPHLVFHDSWFSSVKAVEYQNTLHVDDDGTPAGHECVGALKTNHSCFPKAELEKKMDGYPSGSYLVLECTTPKKGCKLLAIGYKYNARKVLCFIATKNAGTTRPGNPYKCRFPDSHGNTQVKSVIRPDLISKYFEASNIIDSHNHARQHLLALEKRWVTRNPWFRINTTFIGLTVTDAWHLVQYHRPDNHSNVTMKEFANRLAWDCINNPYLDRTASTRTYIQGDDDDDSEREMLSTQSTNDNNRNLLGSLVAVLQGLGMDAESATSTISPLSASGSSMGGFSGEPRHDPIKNPDKGNDGRAKRRRCVVCSKPNTPWMCSHPACRAKKTTANGVDFFGTFICNTIRDGDKTCAATHRDQVCEH